jgi:low affinity Fe/Cu permease
MHEAGFSQLAKWTARQCGRSYTFALAIALILVWAATGPLFHFSDTWQLVINTGTTIITFLMVFLIQNTQNRDAQAVQLKLDELIRVNRMARNAMIDLEDLSEEELERIREKFAGLAEQRASAAATAAAAAAGEDCDDAKKIGERAAKIAAGTMTVAAAPRHPAKRAG